MSWSLLDPLPHEFDMHPQVIELIRIGQRHGESRHFRFNAVERLQSASAYCSGDTPACRSRLIARLKRRPWLPVHAVMLYNGQIEV